MGKLLGMGCCAAGNHLWVQVGLVVMGMLVPQLPLLIYWLRSSYLQRLGGRGRGGSDLNGLNHRSPGLC